MNELVIVYEFPRPWDGSIERAWLTHQAATWINHVTSAFPLVPVEVAR